MTSHHEYRCYPFRITYRPEDPAYTVEFPGLSDIITGGATLNQAFAHACEALDLHLESLQKLGMEPPAPRHRLVVEAIG